MRYLLTIIAALLPHAAQADYVIAAHMIRANASISAQDVIVKSGDMVGAAQVGDIVGMEARVVLYPGRPIRLSDVVPPAAVERNQVVPLIYQVGGLQISTEGRALARAAAGDTIRVMNLSSRSTVYGRVTDGGEIIVSR